ncbi:hypothetical protein PanWU01x14_342140 [Parasponia andersonii]|uniref:Gag1-like clamp domain-containing protein n=1 Tax=Parasponia andersonii TaxID=3476 RepID=A0A2P5ADU5_PARAD|nr:hypothetical protein PanWU01x14_342140 [Parasponia andersonii]
MYSKCCLLSQTERCFGKKPCCTFLVFSGAYVRALVLLIMEKFKGKCKTIFSSRGCLGCFTKPSLIIAVDEPSKGLRIQGRAVKKSSFSEDLWSSSTIEMENGGLPSQRSISSITTSNHPPDPHATPTSTSNPHKFVNHGLLLWNQTRQQWLGNKKSQIKTQSPEPRISWNAIYESLLGTSEPFPHPIPLSEMIDFLVDIWEREGLYD